MYDEYGREVPDKTPVALPIGYERPEPLEQMIARMIRVQSVQAAKEGFETLEEADDFDVDDDEKLVSPYQFTEMQEEHLAHGKQSRTAEKPVDKSGKSASEKGEEKPEVKPTPKAEAVPQKTAEVAGVAQ